MMGQEVQTAEIPSVEDAVRVRGFEPPRAFAHRDLNPARLPSFATPAWCLRGLRNGGWAARDSNPEPFD